MKLGKIGRSIGRTLLDSVGRTAGRIQESKPLPADLLESDDAYLVIFDAPGASGSDVQVRFLNGAVLVRIDRFRSFYEGFEMVFPGRGLALDGRVKLDDDVRVDAESATATLRENGTLEVYVPKREPVDEASAIDEPVDDASIGDEAVGSESIDNEPVGS